MNSRLLYPRTVLLFLSVLLCSTLHAQETSWRFVGRPDGGRVTSIASLSSGESFVFIASERRAYRSTDDGTTWTRLDPTAFTTVQSVIGGGRHPIYLLADGTLYASTDHGMRWNALPGEQSPTLGIWLDSSGALFAQRELGLDRSTDGGATWTTCVTLSGGVSLQFAAGKEGWVYIAQNGVLYRSSDGGTTWTTVDSLSTRVTAIATDSSGTLYAGTFDRYGDLARSVDHGDTWEDLLYFGLDSALVRIVTYDDGDVTAADATGALAMSVDHGHSWIPGQLPRGQDVTGFAGTAAGTLLCGATGAGVLRYDAAKWTPSNRGIDAGIVAGVAVGPDGSLFIGAWTGPARTILRSTDGGQEWVNSGVDIIAGDAPVLVTRTRNILAVTSGGIIRAALGGAGWAYPATNLTPTLSSLYTTSDGAVYVSRSGWAIYRSTDDTMNWRRLTDIGDVAAITGAALAGDHLVFPFSSSSNGQPTGGVLLISPSDGSRIAKIDLGSSVIGNLLQTRAGTLIGISRTQGAGTVTRSLDGGRTWETIADPTVAGAVADALDSLGRVIVSTSSGTAYSSDEGRTWTQLTAVPDGRPITSLAVSPRGDIYGSNEVGVYETTLAASVDVVSNGQEAFALESIAPNPASGAAMLRVRLDRASSVSVRLFDPLGREAVALPAMRLDPGAHDIPIDVSALAPGVYICDLGAGESVRAVRLVVAR